jgi:hypothetical protein
VDFWLLSSDSPSGFLLKNPSGGDQTREVEPVSIRKQARFRRGKRRLAGIIEETPLKQYNRIFQ